MPNNKWLEYSVKILVAADAGARTIMQIHEHVGESKTYVAKVIAILRNGGLIDKNYNLAKPLSEIMIRDVWVLFNDLNSAQTSNMMGKVNGLILSALEVPIVSLVEDQSASK